MSLIYVGSPYSNGDLEYRYRQAMHYVAALKKARKWAFSPIVYCHEMASIYKFPTDGNWWAEFNFIMLEKADFFHVLQLDGWEQSGGLQMEIAFWSRLHRGGPVFVNWGPTQKK